MKIVNLDGYSTNPGDLSWEQFEKYGDFVVYERTKPEEIIERAKDADCLIINKSYISAEIIEKLPKLKYVGLQSTGYNAVDCKAAKEKGIIVSNIPSYSTNEVAQLVFALILEITNQVALHSDAVHSGEWSSCPDFCFWKSPLEELNNKTIGIIGFGSIGKRVAEISKAFGMKVLVNTPHPTDDSSVTFCSFDELLKNSDIITCHCPLNEETENLINKDSIEKMKNTAIFINTSRGPVVDDKALADALNEGSIKAAGLDVLRVEPPTDGNPLLTAKNCYITPHIAWAAVETRARLLEILEENLKSFLDGKPQNVVN
ncbi:MAG: D-2-hydroxyacid dehydrogenase [Ruminococcaceae bacterium]|nr:D-2-hydroxyacid dehydrogenase [Oscillospiraceae bacterium]